jgi:hypothetical protein
MVSGVLNHHFGEIMSKFIRIIAVTALFAGTSAMAATEETATEEATAPETALVVTSEDLSARCILSVVVTAVDGKEVKESDDTSHFDFEAGEHSISGYGGVDPTQCATFSEEGGVELKEGEHIGQSTLKFKVEPGKEYYLGVDVRSADRSTWKIVVWKIKH